MNSITNDSVYVLRAIKLSREINRHSPEETKEYELAKKAVDRALAMKDTTLYARALDNLGLLYRFHKRYDQAIPLHKRAFELIADKDVNPISKMIIADNLGVAARYNEQYDLAATYLFKALRLAEANHELRNIAIASNNLGNALSNIPEREDEAISYFKKAMDAEEKRGNDLGMAMNLLSISTYYIKKKDRKNAYKSLDRLKRLNEKMKDTFGLAITNEAYGRAYIALNSDSKKAEKYYKKALKGYKTTRNFLNVSEVLNYLGDERMRNSDLKGALAFYNRSMEMADSISNKTLIMKNAFDISSIKEKQGAFHSALYYYKKGKIYEDSIDLANQKIKIAALSNQYNLDKKENQIALLQKDQALKDDKITAQHQELKSQRRYTVLLSIGVIAIIVFAIIHLRNRKAKLRAEEQLQEKEKHLLKAEYERNMAQAEIMISRMQINPHFIFNCLNAIKLLVQKKETKKANQYITNFSRFTRMVLEMPKKNRISLSEELKLIEYYLKLEEKRFNDELQFTINTCPSSDLEAIKIPPLLLQPFVENAIWHGILPSPKSEKCVLVDVHCINGMTQISIDDNGVGRKKNGSSNRNKTKRSLGTKITKDRIDQFNQSYDCHIDLNIVDKSQDAGGGTRVVLTIGDKNLKPTNPLKIPTL